MSDLGLPVLVSGQEPAALAVCGRGEKRAGVSGGGGTSNRHDHRHRCGEKHKRDASQSRENSEKAIRAFSTSSASCAKKGESRTEKGDENAHAGMRRRDGRRAGAGNGTHACTRCAPRARRLRKSP